jgi:hypothetical protein
MQPPRLPNRRGVGAASMLFSALRPAHLHPGFGTIRSDRRTGKSEVWLIQCSQLGECTRCGTDADGRGSSDYHALCSFGP